MEDLHVNHVELAVIQMFWLTNQRTAHALDNCKLRLFMNNVFPKMVSIAYLLGCWLQNGYPMMWESLPAHGCWVAWIRTVLALGCGVMLSRILNPLRDIEGFSQDRTDASCPATLFSLRCLTFNIPPMAEHRILIGFFKPNQWYGRHFSLDHPSVHPRDQPKMMSLMRDTTNFVE